MHELIKRLPIESPWHDRFKSPESSGTLKKWAQNHDGKTVDTFQVSFDQDGNFYGLWCPLGRVIDSSSRATYMRLDGSVRDYAGVRTYHSSDNLYIGRTDHQIIAYSVINCDE